MSAARRERAARARRTLLESAFIWPMLVLLGTLVLAPAVYAIFRSFYDWSPGYESPFVGIDNFKELFSSSVFREIGRNELFFMVGVPIWAGVPLVVALLLFERVPFAGAFRTIFFFPAVLSPVILGLVFRSLLRPDGIVNSTLESIGLGGLAQNWIDEPALVKPVIILVALWYSMGFGVIFYSAALSTVPTELFEAAELDGASWWQRLRYVVLPRILPIFLLNVVFSVATVFLLFPYSFVLTRGGPGFTSTTIDYDIYANSFQFGYFGLAAAESVLLLLVMLGVLAALFRFGRKAYVE